ncbi:hypothetical protein GLP30_17200 [Photobacterium phosphoreum]|uniref:Uncharacterized protein n=1 Tax=Photobacterium phosphoreum TaxID=659 RepID=A0AAW4ZZG5_PHOPO|nr:hypothetical protein [Photobacterium phosphoreum]MCD9492609.1 hypothetical protein [Photobacterium phosphoreum]MCF2191826.1 hypothetical protein [Photobacterium phosphoreum]MCF2303441.1 hypothetical protein [Photobacterium phosphoreum]
MTRSDIEIKLKPFTESITDSSISTLSAIRLHLPLLIDMRNIGVSVPLIIEISGCSYSVSTFYSKFSQLRKNSNINISKQVDRIGNQTVNQDDNILVKSKTPSIENTSNANVLNIVPDIEEWKLAFSRTISVKIPDNLIKKLAVGFSDININLDNWDVYANTYGIKDKKRLLYVFSSRRLHTLKGN